MQGAAWSVNACALEAFADPQLAENTGYVSELQRGFDNKNELEGGSEACKRHVSKKT